MFFRAFSKIEYQMDMTFYKSLSPQFQFLFFALTLCMVLGAIASTAAFSFSYFVSGIKEWRDAESAQLYISGKGKVAVRPDIAVFTAGVVTQAKKVKDAQDENTRRSNAVIDYIKKQGLAERDVKTIGYSVAPQYVFEKGGDRRRPPDIASYEVRHSLEIKVRDLTSVDTLLGGVVLAGANEVGSINFQVENDEAVKREARKLAIEDAEDRAQALAKDLGVRLVRIVGFSESGNGGPIFAASLKGGFGGDFAPSPAPEVAPGEQEVHSAVTITYEFR